MAGGGTMSDFDDLKVATDLRERADSLQQQVTVEYNFRIAESDEAGLLRCGAVEKVESRQ